MYASESRFILFLDEGFRVLFLLVVLRLMTMDGFFFDGEVACFAFVSEHVGVLTILLCSIMLGRDSI